MENPFGGQRQCAFQQRRDLGKRNSGFYMPHILCGNPQRLHPAKLLHRPHRGKQKLLLNFETVEIPHPVAGPVAQQPFRLFAADRLNARRNHLAGKVVDLMVECKLHSAHRIDQGPDSGKGDGGRTVNLKAELASQNTGNPLCRVVGSRRAGRFR